LIAEQKSIVRTAKLKTNEESTELAPEFSKGPILILLFGLSLTIYEGYTPKANFFMLLGISIIILDDKYKG
jgi:hypothetical protein